MAGTYTVSLRKAIDFAPASEDAEIIQNVRMILGTCIGSSPLFRAFGISWEHLDKPIPVARTLMRVAIVDAIREFEPRAKVQAVIYDDEKAVDGMLGIRVVITIGGDA